MVTLPGDGIVVFSICIDRVVIMIEPDVIEAGDRTLDLIVGGICAIFLAAAIISHCLDDDWKRGSSLASPSTTSTRSATTATIVRTTTAATATSTLGEYVLRQFINFRASRFCQTSNTLLRDIYKQVL